MNHAYHPYFHKDSIYYLIEIKLLLNLPTILFRIFHVKLRTSYLLLTCVRTVGTTVAVDRYLRSV